MEEGYNTVMSSVRDNLTKRAAFSYEVREAGTGMDRLCGRNGRTVRPRVLTPDHISCASRPRRYARHRAARTDGTPGAAGLV